METLLDSHIGQKVNFKDASKGLRFANLIIDYFGYFVVSAVIGALMVLVLGEDSLVHLENSNFLVEYFFGSIVIILYYVTCEHLFKGKTLGKLITRTRAINIDGSRMTLKTILLRTLSRIVPFEAFSFLGDTSEGWHDKWTDTRVIMDSGWKQEVV